MADRRFPNLFLIGAMKSGTTTLHHLLGTHPEIFMAQYKEPQYFTGHPNPNRFWFVRHGLPDHDAHWYFALFAEAHHDSKIKYAGESSTDYTQRPTFEGCAERIGAFNPEARILYIIRDPIERSIAHFWHNVRTLQETRSPIEAVREDSRL